MDRHRRRPLLIATDLVRAGALLGAALAETIGLRPTLWLFVSGFALAVLWLIAARGALTAERTEPQRNPFHRPVR